MNEFQQWLDREGKKVNRYRGGFAISGGGFLVQDGTAMHWAAYYGSCDIVKMLTDNGAGGVLCYLHFNNYCSSFAAHLLIAGSLCGILVVANCP